jgi:hypothetical protein
VNINFKDVRGGYMTRPLFLKYCLVLLLLIHFDKLFAADPLLQQSDLQYMGAFRVPHGTFGGSSFEYGGTALAYNAANNSLFVVGHDWHQQVAEISIPAVVNSSNLASLNTATVLQSFKDATEGKLGLIGSGTAKIGGLMVYQGKLYVTGYLYYDGASVQVNSHFTRPLNLSTNGQVQGPYQVDSGGQGVHFVNGYMIPIPSAYQSNLGAPAMTINGNGRISSTNTWGPDAFAFDPAKLGVISPVPSIPLLYYSQSHPTLGQWNGTGPYYNATDNGRAGAVFPTGSRSVLYFGRHGIGTFCYGEGTSDQSLVGKIASAGDIYCYDPSSAAKGTHAYPYVYQVWSYDVNDLVAVKNGTKNPWEPIPVVWNFELPFQDSGRLVGGVAYDPATQRIFLSQQFGEDGIYPIIHVFKINLGTSTAPPPTVTLAANPSSVSSGSTSTLAWSSTNTTSCTASGAWSGTKATAGSQSTGTLTATSTYSLTCAGVGGSAGQSVAVTVTSAPSTPPPSSGINVSSIGGLQSAVAGLTSNSTILLADGTYNLSAPLYLPQNISNVTIKGASGNRDSVIIKGPGMTNSAVAFGFWADNVNGVIFQDMTMRDFSQHAIILNGGVDNPVFRNLHIIDIGDQFLKNNPTTDGLNGVDNGVLENSLLEYSSVAPDPYTNGLDVHRGKNWLIRGNTFKNFRTSTALTGPAILMWNGSSDTTVVRNTFINNQRDISLGLDPSIPVDQSPDHARGLIANNFIYKTSNIAPDVPIAVFDSPQTKVYYNTILVNGGYPNAIEYRFSRTTGVDIKNNLTDGSIVARDGASGTVTNNITNASSNMFVNPAAGDLHLKSTASIAIDKGTAVTVNDDFDGQSRPLGNGTDIGADEYNPTTMISLPVAPSDLLLK